MNSRKIYIAIFITSILGLFVVQYQYLKIGLNLAKVQFNKKIATAGEDIKQDLESKNQMTFLVGQAITKDDSYFNLSIDSIEDASRYFLKDFIAYRLTKNGIDTDFSYRLFTKDSVLNLKSPTVFKNKESVITFPIEIEGYLPKLIKKNVILELQFKDINAYFLYQLNGLTIPSFLFMIVIILIFIWVLKSFYWQRKLITTTNEFINNLTHELKTPIFSIGLATKMLEEDVPQSKKPVIDIIKQQIKRLNQHVDKVLELGELEFQKKIFILKKVNFKQELLNLCKDFEALSKLQDIDFEYNLEEGDYFLLAESSHLINAINNVLDNARKYASNEPQIKLIALINKNQLIVSVSDNGPGISEHDQRQIFKKYFRVTNGNVHKVKGYGLGLSYVKEVVKKHKGKVIVESKLGLGTTIKIMVPMAKQK